MKKYFIATIFGITVIALLMIILSFILAGVVRFAAISPNKLIIITTVLAMICFIFGGIISGIKGKTNGLLIGLITGGVFSICVLAGQALLYQTLFTSKQIFIHLLYLICVTLGSVIGVNLVQTKEE